MMPRISVFLPTFRPGGIDIAARSLLCQQFKDFEVIVADELDRRAEWTAALAGLSLKFADLSRSLFPRSSAPIAHNECIRIATGEICVFMSDYAICQPDWLATHWKIWEGSEKYCCAGPFQFVMPPVTALRVAPPIKLGREWMVANEAAVSIFDREIAGGDPQAASIVDSAGCLSSQDPKLALQEGPVDRRYYYNKNEAAPLAALRKINGADEDFNGLHPYDDAALALRLYAVGVRWWLAHRAKIEIVQIRQWCDQPKVDRPTAAAEMVYRRVQAQVSAGIYETSNGLRR